MKSGYVCPHGDNEKHIVNTRTALQLSLGIKILIWFGLKLVYKDALPKDLG